MKEQEQNSHSTAADRLLRIAVLNLMPFKEVTERDFLALLEPCGHRVSITWLRLRSHVSRHTSSAHLDASYTYFDEVEDDFFDGLIVTGAPVEHLPFEEVDYWPELTHIFDWSRRHVLSTIYVCWGAQAGLYHHYGVGKYGLPSKRFGLYAQRVTAPIPFLRGLEQGFLMPHSRHTEVRAADIQACGNLQVNVCSENGDVSVVSAMEGREIFITGHMEYALNTLDNEYRRDKDKRSDVGLPENYYPHDDPGQLPTWSWHEAALRLYRNWTDFLAGCQPLLTRLELLAPAKDLACGIAAVDHGADAVYIGAGRFGAREAAGNSAADIATLCRYAHQYGVRVYVTVNTIVYDSELSAARSLLQELKAAGVDAVLLQDMGLLAVCREIGIPVHASTQTDNRTPDKVKWLHDVGFSRVVLARELSVDDISRIHRSVPDVELEAFVHGALCVSMSGLCYASQYCFGRSANRGACAQFCRMKFDLLDADGHELVSQRHLLSLKDMCRIDYLEELAAAGVQSFKIEGRLKGEDYVKNVVAAYSQALDRLVADHPYRYGRASRGRVTYFFEPDLNKTFNRGYTDYYLHGRSNKENIASFDTPKALGEFVGRVKEIRGDVVVVSSSKPFANGDGLCFFTESGELEGMRVNRAEGNHLHLQQRPSALKPGVSLYRNQDAAFKRLLSGSTAERRLLLTMTLDTTADGFVLRSSDGVRQVEATVCFAHQKALRPQPDNMCRQLSKLGNTPYECADVVVSPEAAELFIPNSLLSDLRRQVVTLLMTPAEPARTADTSLAQPSVPPLFPQSVKKLYAAYPYMYNVANSASGLFYASSGVDGVGEAFELDNRESSGDDVLLMQCRHCLRHALGCCVKRGGRRPEWHEPLFLRLGDGRRFRLSFDCGACQMNVYAVRES